MRSRRSCRQGQVVKLCLGSSYAISSWSPWCARRGHPGSARFDVVAGGQGAGGHAELVKLAVAMLATSCAAGHRSRSVESVAHRAGEWFGDPFQPPMQH